MNKLFLATIVTFLVIVIFFLYGLVNGSGCSYEINAMKTSENRLTYLTCYRGKVTALHYHKSVNDDDSIWEVEARQLIFGSQLIYIIYDRKIIKYNKEHENDTDRYNRLLSNYNTLFYFYKIKNGKIYIISNFPKKEIFISDFVGKISLF